MAGLGFGLGDEDVANGMIPSSQKKAASCQSSRVVVKGESLTFCVFFLRVVCFLGGANLRQEHLEVRAGGIRI